MYQSPFESIGANPARTVAQAGRKGDTDKEGVSS